MIYNYIFQLSEMLRLNEAYFGESSIIHLLYIVLHTEYIYYILYKIYTNTIYYICLSFFPY